MIAKQLFKKNDSCIIPFKGVWDINLHIDYHYYDEVIKYYADLDLCLFYRTCDNNTGGVFPTGYTSKKESTGDLSKFPYMFSYNDTDTDFETSVIDKIRISNFDNIDTAYIVIINYAAITKQIPLVPFHNSCHVTLENSNYYFDILNDNKNSGCICLIATLSNEHGKILLTNKSEIMDAETAFETIPGFAHICSK